MKWYGWWARVSNEKHHRTLCVIGTGFVAVIIAFWTSYDRLSEKPESVQTHSGDSSIETTESVTIGIKLKEYEGVLQYREQEMRERLMQANRAYNERILNIEPDLAEVTAGLQDSIPTLAYHKAKHSQAHGALGKLKGEPPWNALAQAQQTLASADTVAAESLFVKTVEQDEGEAVELASELDKASYSLSHYGKRYRYYFKGANLQPDNRVYGNLAIRIAAQSRRNAEVQPFVGKAPARREEAVDPRHIEVAQNLNNLERLDGAQGQYAKTEPLDQNKLELAEKVLSPAVDPARENVLPNRIRPSTAKDEATPEAVEEAMARMSRNARERRLQWKTKRFEEFEQSVYKEPFEGGKYIVSGDIPIADRKQLQEFFETRIKQEPPETAPGALIVHQLGGQGGVWNTTKKKQLTYCVSRSFRNRYQKVVADMAAAGNAWEQVADVDYIHVPSQDGNCSASNPNVLFDVNPVDADDKYLARAFLPNEPRLGRNVLIDGSTFELDPNGMLQLVGILRHELGHTLGWQHEHTRPEAGACFDDDYWRPLTHYDGLSVMHYPQCNGGADFSWSLTALDKNGAACLYGAAPGFHVDPNICQLDTDDTKPTTTQSGPRTAVFENQRILKNQQRTYGPFAVAPGTLFEAKMTGRGAAGDPDLYVRFGQRPGHSPGQFACRPYLTGADETCSIDVPASQLKASVMVHGYDAGAYDLTVTFRSVGPP